MFINVLEVRYSRVHNKYQLSYIQHTRRIAFVADRLDYRQVSVYGASCVVDAAPLGL